MSRDYRLRVSSQYFLYLYVQKIWVWRLWAPGGREPVCLAHSAHPIATPLEIVSSLFWPQKNATLLEVGLRFLTYHSSKSVQRFDS